MVKFINIQYRGLNFYYILLTNSEIMKVKRRRCTYLYKSWARTNFLHYNNFKSG